jgi:HEAT repeat protein
MGFRTIKRSVQGDVVPIDASVEELIERITQGDAAEKDFYALAAKDEPRAAEAIFHATGHHDWRVRRLATEVLGVRDFGQGAVQRLIALLADSSEYVVRTACETLGILADPSAHDAVLALLKSPLPYTREVAVRSLCTLFVPEDFETLLHVSNRDPAREVRTAAAECLYNRESGAHWRELFGQWFGDHSYHHKRVWACRLAERFGTSETIVLLEEMEHDENGHVRWAASRAIRAIRQRS